MNTHLRMPMIEVKELSAGYDNRTIVKDITFSLQKGEKLAIIGANGCGKTTLLRALAGMIPYTGNILVHSRELQEIGRKEIAKTIALMQQLDRHYLNYTVYETVMFGRYVHSKGQLLTRTSQDDRTIVLEALKRNGLFELRNTLITQLSGGQLQRVFLTRIFVQDPTVILLDEPMNHLDMKYQIELIQYLNDWTRHTNHCVVGVFHDLNLALDFADVILLLDEGKIKAYDKVEAFPFQCLEEVYGIPMREYMVRSLRKWDRLL